jgi:hypothetical protein
MSTDIVYSAERAGMFKYYAIRPGDNMGNHIGYCAKISEMENPSNVITPICILEVYDPIEDYWRVCGLNLRNPKEYINPEALNDMIAAEPYARLQNPAVNVERKFSPEEMKGECVPEFAELGDMFRYAYHSHQIAGRTIKPNTCMMMVPPYLNISKERGLEEFKQAAFLNLTRGIVITFNPQEITGIVFDAIPDNNIIATFHPSNRY